MSKIDKLKNDFGCETSEELFGIDEPSDFQCSFINELVKYAGYIEKDTDIKGDDFDDLVDKLRDVEYYISDIEEGLETLRDAIDSVRSWGQGWKDLVKRIVENENINVDDYT